MANEINAVAGQLIGMPLAGPESFSQQQLDYLKRALGVDETVLYETANGAAIANFPITLSEAPANFETVKIYFQPWSDIKTVSEFMGNADRYCLLSSWADGSGNAFYFNQMLLLNGLQVSFVKGEYVRFGDTVRNTQTSNFYVFKIVGIHRIAGGN